MAESPRRKERATEDTEAIEIEVKPKASPTRRKEPEYRISLELGDLVEYGGMSAMVTGVSKRNGTVYLDTPVCRWVPASDCAKA